jgi:hypothetical protein
MISSLSFLFTECLNTDTVTVSHNNGHRHGFGATTDATPYPFAAIVFIIAKLFTGSARTANAEGEFTQSQDMTIAHGNGFRSYNVSLGQGFQAFSQQ